MNRNRLRIFLCGIAGLAATASLAGGLAAPADGHGDKVLGDRIVKAQVFQGKLWLLGLRGNSEPGGLISIDLASQERTAHFSKGVVDVAAAGDAIWIVRRGDRKVEFVASRRTGTDWQDTESFEAPSENPPVALLILDGIPTVLCRNKVEQFSWQGHWRAGPLHGVLRSGMQVSAAVPRAGGDIYLGFNNGEFGGGMQRVRLNSGDVEDVERRDTKELCAGPLNSACDPVTGVIADPGNPQCVLASVGLAHLGVSEGRVLRVCASQVEVASKSKSPDEASGPAQSEPIFGLASVKDGFLAVTHNSVVRFSADGTRQEEFKLPDLKPQAGVRMSRDIPGAIVLRTDVNWAVSTSGYTPLLVGMQ